MTKARAMVLALLLVVSFGLAALAGEVLRILTWEGYAPPELVNKFEKETGIRVEVAYVGDNNALIAKLAATRGTGYDLVQPTANWVVTAQKMYGIYQPLDLSRIRTELLIPSLFESITKMTSLEGKVYAIPHFWGTTAMIVNTDLAPNAGKSYNDLFDPAYCGHVSYRAKYDTLYMTAYALGYDPAKAVASEEEYREVMEAVLQKLIEHKKCVKTYWSSAEQIKQLVLSNEVWVGTMWGYIALKLMLDHPNLKYCLPKEGAIGWVDTLAIPVGARNVDAAYKWINFIIRPDNASKLIELSGLSVSTKDAEWPNPEMKALFDSVFTPEQIANIKWYFPLTPYALDIEADVQERLLAAPAG